MLATACVLLLAGCVIVPTSGHVQAVNATQGGAGGGQSYLQPIPVPPGHGWTPQQIVSGFLAANASFANGHAVAREYLLPSASQGWRPGWAVTIFAQNPSIVSPPPHIPQQSFKTANTTAVEVSGTVLGTVSNSGQYAISPQSHAATQEEKFGLIKQGGEWRISTLPSVVLMTQADFLHVDLLKPFLDKAAAIGVVVVELLFHLRKAQPVRDQLVESIYFGSKLLTLKAAAPRMPTCGSRLLPGVRLKSAV